MSNGFDLKELKEYAKTVLKMANDQMPKESKKYIKKEGNKLNAIDKKVYKQMQKEDEGWKKKTFQEIEPSDTPEEKKIINRFKAGKAYKFKGTWTCRAFNSAPHAHLYDQGFIHKPHKNQKASKDDNGNDKEFMVPGHGFMDQAAKQFEEQYNQDCESFADEMLKGLR